MPKPAIQRRPVSDEEVRQYRENPPLSTLLPYRFRSGMSVLSVDCRCAGCDKYVQAQNVHGRLDVLNARAIRIDASAYCAKCQMLTLFLYRMREDGNVDGLVGHGWKSWQLCGEDKGLRSLTRRIHLQLSSAMSNRGWFLLWLALAVAALCVGLQQH